jgi:hypothetical protein
MRPSPRTAPVVVLAALFALGAAHARAADDASAGDAGEGSLLKLVDDVASALEKRAQLEHVAGLVRLDVTPSRGIDSSKVERGFLARLKRRLKDGGELSPSTEAPLRCRIMLSEEGGRVWATAVLEGQGLPGPSTVALSRPIDRELEMSLGAVMKSSQQHFNLEKLGVVPAGVLDAMLVDVDGDGVDELAVLGIDGVRFFRANGKSVDRIGNVVKLPADRHWPRMPAGWLGKLDGGKLWAVTSAGHSIVIDPRAQRVESGPGDLVPLRGAQGLCGSSHIGSPVITLPLVTLTREIVRSPGLPIKVRDVATLANGGFIVVDSEGQLLGERGGDPPTLLANERVGDRILLADLDGDGEPELVTTSAAPPGEPDRLVVRRIDGELSTSNELYRSALSGGSIVAIASGRVDLGRVDVVVIEDTGGKEDTVWRMRYAP